MTSSITNFTASSLLTYFQAQQNSSLSSLAAQAAAAKNPLTSASSTATSGDVLPWTQTATNKLAEDAAVLNITDFMDTSNVPLSAGSTTDSKTEQDNQKLFSLYNAVNNLYTLAGMATNTSATSGQLAGYNTRFQSGLQQIESYLNTASFNNFTLQTSTPSSSVTSTAQVPMVQFGYTGGSISSDADVSDALPGVSASDSFDISVTKNGTTTDVPIDLSQVQGPLTIDNIVSYVNQQLSADGFSTTFKRVMTSGSVSDLSKATWGIQINTVSSEQVSLSSTAATPALYFAGTTGSTTASGTGAADNQGRLVKLTDLSSGDPTSEFSATTTPTTGTTTASSTVVDSNGNTYVLGNATGNIGSQLNQGSQDVYLSKYDSAGNLQWTKLLGSAGSASGSALALDPKGGVVVVGSTTAALSTTSIDDGNTDSFVSQYDANGNQVWTTQVQTLNQNQAAAVSVDASGNVYVGGQVNGAIAAGQTASGGSDAYLVKLNSSGVIQSEQQFGTSGNDTVAATAVTASGDLMVASVQNGEAILSKYAGGNTAAAPTWTEDLGSLQGGSISGLAVNGNQVYVSGTTQNAALDANGTATIANASSGGNDAFVFSATDNGSSATANYVSYVGTGASDQGGAVTVGPDGTVYLAGTTKGTFAGQTRNATNTNNAFVAALGSDGTIDWVRQYGGADGQSTGQGIAIDPTGSSVLDALGLPRGTVTTNQTLSLTAQTTLRAGDSFQIKIEGVAPRTFTITADANDTLQTLVTKINGELGSNGTASIHYSSTGEGLTIQVAKGVTAQLIAGPADTDALGRLGIAAGTLSNGQSTSSTSSSSSSSTSSSSSSSKIFGLGLSSNMDISTTSGANTAQALLHAVLNSIKNIYQTTNTPAASSSPSSSGGTVSATTQTQLASYSLALNLLSSSASSFSTTIGTLSSGSSSGIVDLAGTLGASLFG